MRKKKVVSLLRSGNRLVVDPSTPQVRDLLTPQLSYTEKVFVHGAEEIYRKKMRRPLFDEVEWECWADDHKGRIATSFGFRDRIVDTLEKAGYEVSVRWATKQESEVQAGRLNTVYAPQWNRIDEFVADSLKDPKDPKSGFRFRFRQKKALKLIATEENGRIDCPPGWGKGTLIMLAATLFPQAKIAVVTKNIPVLRTRLYPELSLNLPSVGVVGGGKKVKGQRVMCYSADSLHHAKGDEDFVFVDEGHQACADNFAAKMAVFEHARVWMFSASWNMRLDNKDMRAEAMSGPIRLVVTPQESVAKGITAPQEVRWADVIMDENPCGEAKTRVMKKKLGIWRNTYRNKIIARDAKQYGKDKQVLITCETLEHAVHLKKQLPNYKLVYSDRELKEDDLKWFRENFPDEFEEMTKEKRDRRTKKFEAGTLKRVIATPVWNIGVDFRNLDVLIRADAGGSPINDVQIPGRNARFKRDEAIEGGAEQKIVGIIHDYKDQFDPGFDRKAKGREGMYEKQGFAQVHPDPKTRSRLRQEMNFGGVD